MPYQICGSQTCVQLPFNENPLLEVVVSPVVLTMGVNLTTRHSCMSLHETVVKKQIFTVFFKVRRFFYSHCKPNKTVNNWSHSNPNSDSWDATQGRMLIWWSVGVGIVKRKAAFILWRMSDTRITRFSILSIGFEELNGISWIRVWIALIWLHICLFYPQVLQVSWL